MPLPSPQVWLTEKKALDKKEKSKILIGCDPELFFIKDNQHVPAIGLVGGTKDHPKPYGIGHVQEDNVMAEFNIPPADNENDFDTRIQSMIDNIRTIAEKNGMDISAVPYAKFRYADLMHPQARTVGCDPDYNAWTMLQNQVVEADKLADIRTASGHVHISLLNPDKHPKTRTTAVKLCDLYLGVPMALLESKNSLVRRQYYGAAGAYRPKPYGIEYRVLDNMWIMHSALRKFIFNQAQLVSIIARTGGAFGWFDESTANRCINKGDKAYCQKVLDNAGIKIPAEVREYAL